jgi:hypothetical protein
MNWPKIIRWGSIALIIAVIIGVALNIILSRSDSKAAKKAKSSKHDYSQFELEDVGDVEEIEITPEGTGRILSSKDLYEFQANPPGSWIIFAPEMGDTFTLRDTKWIHVQGPHFPNGSSSQQESIMPPGKYWITTKYSGRTLRVKLLKRNKF